MTVQLLTAADADGSSGTFALNGSVSVVVSGTWNGATITTQVSPDGGTTWVAAGSTTTFTANGHAVLEGYGLIGRLTISSAGTTELNAWIGY